MRTTPTFQPLPRVLRMPQRSRPRNWNGRERPTRRHPSIQETAMTSAEAAGSVLIEVATDHNLVAAAKAFFKGENSIDDMRAYISPFDPADIRIDRNYTAMPIGPGSSILDTL